MRRVVREQSLGFVATVCPDGTPNLSPKGATVVWGDEHLAFLHIHSPTTVANLQASPAIEVNVVDRIVRTGVRFRCHGSRGRGRWRAHHFAARRSDGLRHVAVAVVGDPYPGGSG
jgi:hypothetical protein